MTVAVTEGVSNREGGSASRFNETSRLVFDSPGLEENFEAKQDRPVSAWLSVRIGESGALSHQTRIIQEWVNACIVRMVESVEEVGMKLQLDLVGNIGGFEN